MTIYSSFRDYKQSQIVMLIESEHSAPSTSFRVNPEYAEMAELIPGLYICGVSALTPENIQEHSISLIINATNEVCISSFLCIRIY